MLFKNTVSEKTLGILKQISSDKYFEDFVLVGGTNLSLRFGHRISDDLDFFTTKPFDSEELSQNIKSKFPKSRFSLIKENTVVGDVSGVKIDFILHKYPLLKKFDVIEKVTLASAEDVAAMKLNAIAQRGAKKDFFDIFELLKLYKIDELLGFYSKKYKTNDIHFIIRALTYFDDAELQPDVISLSKNNWNNVKKSIEKQVKKYVDGLILAE
jgi:predicted nucleotidyltransferase component of viral defense system